MGGGQEGGKRKEEKQSAGWGVQVLFTFTALDFDMYKCNHIGHNIFSTFMEPTVQAFKHTQIHL